MKNILILQGGKNEEHEISLNTAGEVENALIKLGYKTEFLNVNPETFYNDIKKYNPTCCFNALHGTFGEDGQVQKILYNFNIPFTHSGVKASKNAFNKSFTKNLLDKSEVNLIESDIFKTSELNRFTLQELFKKFQSFIIKPNESGSSYGIQIVRNYDDIDFILDNNLFSQDIYKNHKYMIVEKYINGKELTVSVIEKEGFAESIEVTEILSKNTFFDYQSKYTKGYSKHIIPAKIPNNIYNQALEHAKIAHDNINCHGVTRSDFILDEKNNKLFFLEINTQPGLTSISLVPEQLRCKGINFIELIESLVKLAKCRK